MHSGPIADDELPALLGRFAGREQLALAVSGGADSVALMHLVARWRRGSGDSAPGITVLTVDHGLRAGSAAEADQVGRWAHALGLGHTTLEWRGTKPGSNLQAAARKARYDLMTAYCHRHGIPAIVTAHHLQDQCETVLMRLGRGSGVDGLAAMLEVGAWAGIEILRPLLAMPKVRLIATLERAGVGWIEDPSNRDDRFERVRMRRAMATLETLGVTAEALARTARRMNRARAALDETTTRFLRANLQLNDAGYARIGRRPVVETPEEITLRAFARLLAAVGGSGDPPRLDRLESLLARVRSGPDGARTLAGCQVEVRDAEITFWRESGRAGLPELRLASGATGVWDRRFHVRACDDGGGPVVVRALRRDGYARVRARLKAPVHLPAQAADGLASFWRDDEILAVPHLRYHAGPRAREDGGGCTAEFVGAGILGRESPQSAPNPRRMGRRNEEL